MICARDCGTMLVSFNSMRTLPRIEPGGDDRSVKGGINILGKGRNFVC